MRLLKKTVFVVFYLLAFHKITRRFFKHDILIVFYHNVCDPQKEEQSLLNPWVSLAAFQRQVNYLKKHYTMISMDQCLDLLKNGGTIPPYTAVLHFDDGYVSQYRHAYPLLKKEKIPAIFYLPTAFVGTDKLFWWDALEYMILKTSRKEITLDLEGQPRTFSLHGRSQKEKVCLSLVPHFQKLSYEEIDNRIKALQKVTSIDPYSDPDWIAAHRVLSRTMADEMQKDGFSFGSHTAHHAIVTRETSAVQKKELEDSTKFFGNRVGIHFCYPNGREGDFSLETKKLLQTAGYRSGSTAIEGLVGSGSDPYELPRIWAGPDFAQFVCRISGIKVLWFRLRKILRKLSLGFLL